LTGIDNSEQLQRVLEALNGDASPGRRGLCAYIIGSAARNPIVQPAVGEILFGGDRELRQNLLEKLKVSSLRSNPELRTRAIAQLRSFAVDPGMPRAKAVTALMGDTSESGVSLLLNRSASAPEFSLRY
jgi:hypothetical protein